jgi:hypothetical protein
MQLVGWRPAEGLLPRARGRADPEVATLVARGGAGPLPGGSRGGSGSRGQLERQAHRGLAPTRGGTRPPGGSGPVEAIPKCLALMGTWGAPDLYELRGKVRRPRSQLPGPNRTPRLPEDKGVGLENPVSTRVDSLSGDFLAG